MDTSLDYATKPIYLYDFGGGFQGGIVDEGCFPHSAPTIEEGAASPLLQKPSDNRQEVLAVSEASAIRCAFEKEGIYGSGFHAG